MNRCINPPTIVQSIGRRLEGLSFPDLVAQLRPEERLIGHYDQGLFQNAVDLTAYGRDSDSEFWVFEDQVGMGAERLGFYAVHESFLED